MGAGSRLEVSRGVPFGVSLNVGSRLGPNKIEVVDYVEFIKPTACEAAVGSQTGGPKSERAD
jgi:hypothetical protein